MNEIVKAGLVGAAVLGGGAVLVVIMIWLADHAAERLKTALMIIIGIFLFIVISIILGSVLLAGMD